MEMGRNLTEFMLKPVIEENLLRSDIFLFIFLHVMLDFLLDFESRFSCFLLLLFYTVLGIFL